MLLMSEIYTVVLICVNTIVFSFTYILVLFCLRKHTQLCLMVCMNWSTVISSLEQHGLNRGEIAQKCNCSLSLINALAQGQRGKRLSYDIGTSLMSLLATASKKSHKKAA